MDTLAPSFLDNTPSGQVAADALSLAVPGLLFENRTPFAAIQFDHIDQHNAAFHIFVAKIGYTIGPRDSLGWAKLVLLDEPVELNTEDRHEGNDPAASVLEESDLAPFKPRCDVIVNALAYAPKKQSAHTVTARLTLAAAPGGTAKPNVLIDKRLLVCGPRWFVKKAAVRRMLELPLKVATLGMVRPSPWKLTKAEPMNHLPVRYEHALGGQCRIDSGSPAAARVPRKNRLAAQSDVKTGDAIAHDACESNPVGKGFTRDWFLKADKTQRLPAPQISEQGKPFNACDFVRGAQGKLIHAPAGFGPIGRSWQPRRALVGKIEEKSGWGPNDIPRLPADFDYAYWNCAPQDQQCDYLNGLEQFTLVNLCSPDHPAAGVDQQNNTVLRFALPQQAMFVLAVTREPKLTVLPLSLDTVVINPETRRVDLVWRGCLDADGAHVSSRLMHVTEAAQIERLGELLRRQTSVEPSDEAKGE